MRQCYFSVWLLALLTNFPITTMAQSIFGVGTKWSDNLSEWELFGESDEIIGELKARWPRQESWTEWDYRLGEISGQIKQKWSNDPNEWEIRGQNQIITARTIWKNDFREWRVSDNQIQISIKCRYGNSIDEWELKTSTYGSLTIRTRWQGDPREWDVYDDTDQAISLPMRMALVFIVLYNSMPR